MSDPLILRIVNWLLSGHSRLQIQFLIREGNENSPFTIADCNELISEAKKLLEESVSSDTSQISTTHIGHFELIYNYFHSIENTDGMLKAMKAKERLLGLVGNSKLTINKKTDININRNVSYDMNRLTSMERVRYKELNDKVSLIITNPTQIPNIISKTKEAAVN